MRFNAKVLGMNVALEGEMSQEQAMLSGPALSQLGGIPDTEGRLSTIKQRYTVRIKQLVQANRAASRGDAVTQTENKRDVVKLLANAKSAAERATAGGFRMNAAERQAFRSVYAALTSAMTFDPSLMRQVRKLHDHVLANLNTEHLLEAGAVDVHQARAQLTLLTDDAKKDLLPLFMALSQVSPEFRNALEAMPGPKRTELDFSSVDGAVDSIGEVAMSTLTRLSIEKPGKIVAVSKELDRLAYVLSAAERENRITQGINEMSEKIDQANAYVAGKIERASNVATAALSRRQLASRSNLGKVAYAALGAVAAIGSKQASAEKGEGLTSFMNTIEGWDAARALLHDLRGQTDLNKAIMRLINPVKAKIDGLRQDFREGTPKILKKKFSRKLKGKEWSAMHAVLGATDIMALGQTEAEALLRDPGSLTKFLGRQCAGWINTLQVVFRPKVEGFAIQGFRKKLTSKSQELPDLWLGRAENLGNQT